MKLLAIIFLSLFTSAVAWSQTPLPLTWVPGGSNNLEANLDVGPTVTLSPTTTVMAAGYYAATNLAEVDPDLAAANIAANVTVFGVAGTLNTIPAPVPKTGQMTSYATGDDGDLQKGVAWPVPRFTDNANGAVRDNLTGLIWLKNASALGMMTNWVVGLAMCNTLANGMYGLSDGSVAGDWRMPNLNEMFSLVTCRFGSPCVPDTSGTNKWTTGNPFTGVVGGNYWTSDTHQSASTYRFRVTLSIPGVGNALETDNTGYVWPVRGGL